MTTVQHTQIFDASPVEVFNAIDDLGVTGTHMTQSSAMMMGSKLNLEFLTEHRTGPGSTYRWSGKMMGMPMDFTVKVTKWVADDEKTWETIGTTRLIIYSWYRMHLKVIPLSNGTQAELSITYERPDGLLNRIISWLFANMYCRWCLRKMLGDAGTAIKQQHLAL